MVLYEWKRKLWHVGTGIIGISIHFATGRDSNFSAMVLLIASIAMFSGEFIRLRFPAINKRILSAMGSIMRKKESKQISGMPYYALGVCLTFFIFPEIIALIAISILVFTDPICSIVGRAYGRHKIINDKSFEGTFAGYISSFIIILGFSLVQSPPSLQVFLFIIIGALLCTLSELFVIIDDNLSLPVLSGVSLTLLNYLFNVF